MLSRKLILFLLAAFLLAACGPIDTSAPVDGDERFSSDGDVERSDLVADGDADLWETTEGADRTEIPDVPEEACEDCTDGQTCIEGLCRTDIPCERPLPQIVSPILHAGALLTFESTTQSGLQVALTASEPPAPDAWVDAQDLVLSEAGRALVSARINSPDCVPVDFHYNYDVRAEYPGAPPAEDSSAIALGDPRLIAWASRVVDYMPGDFLFEEWMDANQALGEAEGTTLDVVSLGQGGQITLAFDPPISDATGADFAVFENSFSDMFIELGYVEISSDGDTFLRFDVVSLTEEVVGEYALMDVRDVYGFAGRYRKGFGTPFDLSVFRQHPAVLDGRVDLGAIRFVRIVDVVGDGSETDSFGHPIYDPTPTKESAGFDLDGIAAMHLAE